MNARLALIGAPGAGKSTVAGELGRRWDCPVRDTDLDYEAAHGHSVADAVIEDEQAFRAVEQDLVIEALTTPGVVVAVGSGALDEAVRSALAAVPVVWLEIGLAEAARRSGLSGMRPAALGNVRGQLHDMLKDRAQVYGSLADLRILTDGRRVDEVAAEIEQWEAQR